MRDALDTLLETKLVFEHEDYYFCKISRRSIKLVKKNEKKTEIHDALDFHGLFGKLN
jgi:hypothetical protein